MRTILPELAIVCLVAACAPGREPQLVSYVDTRVGTDANSVYTDGRYGKGSEEYGQTLPAVLEPNGMTFWTPQTRDTEKKCIAPYYYRDSLFQGFRSSHWITGGCTQDYGSMTLFPATDVSRLAPVERATPFQHRSETATPSYYAVYLHREGILAEMTGRSRSAIFRFTYPEDEPAFLIVNPNSDEGEGYIELDTLRKEIRGYNPIHRIYQGWGQPAGYSGYFVIRFEEELESFGTYSRDSVVRGGTSVGGAAGIGLYVQLRRRPGKTSVTAVCGTSFTGYEGAVKNLEAEIPDYDFDGVRKRLTAIWEQHLSKVEVSRENEDLVRKFYGALYRASFLPRTISDVDGSYPSFSSGTPVRKSPVPHYDDYSMWDTYRALHPLLVLTSPSRSGEMMQSLSDKYREGGWMPIFPCWNSYTAAMIGDHCTAAIGDAFLKGVRNFDIDAAYEGMRKNAFESPESPEEYADGMGRRALRSYLQYGYIPLEDPVREAFHSKEQTSRTLEYAYDDFLLSQVARELGREEDAAALLARSRNYRNVIDPETGYAAGRHADGTFQKGTPPEALARFITEGAPCHYTWYVPQDPYGLMDLMGGPQRYIDKLDSLFAENLYWHGNEPCHQVAYMYNYAGEPWKTQQHVRDILDTQYADAPGGLSGNDDAGQMSAWLVFSSLGFYPVCPGSPYYAIGSPCFDRASLHQENGRTFTLLARKTGDDNRYIQAVTLRGKPYTYNYISHEDILKGGEMVFVMGDSPNPSWGSRPEDLPPSLLNEKPGATVWEIGRKDGSPEEFALASDGYEKFLEKDFGYEDRFFAVGYSRIKEDFPYILPGPADAWGGTAWASGQRTHEVNILFTLGEAPRPGEYALELDLASFSEEDCPLVKMLVNGHAGKFQLSPGSRTLLLPLEADALRKGGNEVVITILEGSWIQFDRVALVGPSPLKVETPRDALVRSVEAADYELDGVQPLLVDVEHLSGEPLLKVTLDGKKVFSKKLEKGRYVFEVPMPAVTADVTSRYRVLLNGRPLQEGEVVRRPCRKQSLADYVDTRMGTAHSRWMIAPGPWMPFGMVKLSPDNQNQGWQAGYQPSLENIGCFSHVHEWTLGGLGVMPTNGPLQTEVGDERHPDTGYRSRMDKGSEVAGIGYYRARLTDYDILAEMTATTRCGFLRFTFPEEGKDNRVLIELHPEAEYDFKVVESGFCQTGPSRVEGYSHQRSERVWRKDADQDYTLHFVMEFDAPIERVDSYRGGELLAVHFDTALHPVVKVRTALSPVSLSNAAENLEKELSGPFGWDFEAVVEHQKKVWNELLGRIEIETDNRLDKCRFYNHLYRSLCGRTIWSDCNGQWVATDWTVQTVEDPSKDVMLSSDAFWNTFWNLNQLWNLVTPEWTSQFVKTQLSLFRASGWLGKGPAGLNYIPVMVAEHEIPLIVGAWQMGIRDFDGHEALRAAVKMQTTPGQKVHKGFAGNRDLAAYLQHGYVPSDKGRFSNTLEYAFDDWTVGQLALSLGDTATFRVFDDRGSWWRHVLDEDGFAHMKDSLGNWAPDFDPFRSGANKQYVEGNAWQLTFFVPQDVPGLVEAIGKERFVQRLSWGFSQDEAWRYNAPGDRYWDHPVVQGNQQSMHFSFLFNAAGQPWNTQRWSRSILERFYGYGVANAYLGDEDQGQLSAWAVMASLGLFQMDGGCAVKPFYELGSPLFTKAVVHLGGRYGRGQDLTIRAKGASRKHLYVKSVRLGGRKVKDFRIPAQDLLKGGELVLEMDDKPIN